MSRERSLSWARLTWVAPIWTSWANDRSFGPRELSIWARKFKPAWSLPLATSAAGRDSSFRLDPQLADERAPFRLFRINVHCLLLRRTGKRLAALLRNARAYLLARERGPQLGIEPIDDGASGPRRRHHAVVDHRHVARHAGLGDGGQVGEHGRAD